MRTIPETYRNRDWPRRVSQAAKDLAAKFNALSDQLNERELPAGGAANDVLTKATGTDYDAAWQAPAAATVDLKPYCVTGTGSDIPAAATQ